jgi:hypothetical protein
MVQIPNRVDPFTMDYFKLQALNPNRWQLARMDPAGLNSGFLAAAILIDQQVFIFNLFFVLS